MNLRSLLPPVLIAGLFALTAFAQEKSPDTAGSDRCPANSSCPTGTCCFMASATNPAPMTTDTCVVSGDKLGEMGKPVEYVYKQVGHPDRVIQLCCKDCIADFEKAPAKYLAKLDAAAAAKAAKK